MGFTSIDDWLNKVTNNSYFYRSDWNKVTATGPYVVGRWYDLSLSPGIPPPNVYGELTFNGGPVGTGWGWTGVGSGGWTFTTTPNFTHTAGTAGNLSQPAMALTNGRYYQLTYTLGWTSGTNIIPYLNGTAGTTRSSASTYTDIIGPVGASGGLVFTPSTDATCTITAVSVIEVAVGGAPMSYVMSDTSATGAMYTGGTVAPKSKHIINAGVISPAATSVPGILMLCDFLLAYPLINGNTASAQTLTTTNALTRYTSGVGVKPFIVNTTTLGATTPLSLTISYTDQAGNSGHSMPLTVQTNFTASSIAGTLIHSAGSTNAYGPFLPLAAGDTGVRSVQTVTMAASGTTSTMALVLAKPLLSIPMTTAGLLAEKDFLNQAPSLPQIADGACLNWLYYAGAATVQYTSFYGYLDCCYG